MTLAKTCALIAIVIAGAATSSYAQSAEAEQLFREGRDLIKQGKLAAGCDKLAGSEHIEPSVGTLLNLGDCRERLGQLASAWAAFRKAESLAKNTARDDKRRIEAARRAAQLESQLAKLTVHIDHPVDGLTVKRGSELLDRAVWNTAMPIDPGTYTIVVEAPGYQPWKTNVAIRSGTTHSIAVPALTHEAITAAPPPPPPVERPRPVVAEAAPAPAAVPLVPMRVSEHEPGIWTPTRKAAAVISLAGGAALGVGIYFGLHSRDLEAQSNARCPAATCTDAEGLRLNQEARDASSRANILYATAGLTIAGATIMWLAGGPERHTIVAPVAGGGQFGAVVARRF